MFYKPCEFDSWEKCFFQRKDSSYLWNYLINDEMTPFEKALVKERIETIKFNTIATTPITDRRKRREAKKLRKEIK